MDTPREINESPAERDSRVFMLGYNDHRKPPTGAPSRILRGVSAHHATQSVDDCLSSRLPPVMRVKSLNIVICQALVS